MQFWIITGGAASGKSRFCEMLARLQPGTLVFSSDEEVHRCLASPEIAARVAALFGAGFVSADASIDRAKLRDLVFKDSGARRELERLLHPMVFAGMKAQLLAARAKAANLFLAEVPLFFESGGEVESDLTVVVAAQVQFQSQRIVDKRGLTDLAAARIIQAQLPLESKIALAGAVVWNEGDPRLLEMQAEFLLQQLP